MEKTYEHPVGIIYPQNQPLNNVQKQEILQIIGDVLENFNHVTDDGNDNSIQLTNKFGMYGNDQLKKKIQDSIGTSANLNENINPNIEILPRSGRKQSELNKNNTKNQVQILEEIEFGDDNINTRRIRVFKFSDSFKQNLEKEMVEIKSRNTDILEQRRKQIMNNKNKMNLEMPWIFPSIRRQQQSTWIQNSRMPSTSFSIPWPWVNFHSEKISSPPDTCQCLNAFDLFVHSHYDPCSEPTPWCFVDSHSNCPDVVTLQNGIQLLYYSSQACLNYK